MSMVNLGIGFQEPLTRPGVKLDEKMSNYSSDSERSRGIYKFQLAGKSRPESKKMSCHAILKSASTKGPGRGGTSHLTDFDETWPV